MTMRALFMPSATTSTSDTSGTGAMMQAIWNGAVIAESPRTIRLEGNHYFPAESVNRAYLIDSEKKSVCVWKGIARYYSLRVGAETNPDAAWYYEHPSFLARRIKGYVAFWNGVTVRDTEIQSP